MPCDRKETRQTGGCPLLSFCCGAICRLLVGNADQSAAAIGYVEQLTEVVKTLRGIKEGSEDSSSPIIAQIFSPEKTEGHNDYSCVVRCPDILDNDKKIFGVDADQALEVSETFIHTLWEHPGIVPCP